MGLDSEGLQFKTYKRRFYKYAFLTDNCKSYEQYEAAITRLYHTIEKGMAYKNYRAGFGSNNIKALISLMENYSTQYDSNSFFYRTGLCVLKQYIEKNREFGYVDEELNRVVDKLPGSPNESGGIIKFEPMNLEQLKSVNYECLIVNRHSVREFSDKPVSVDIISQAVKLAQYTPSACNRQGWRTRIVADKALVKKVLDNQNGNRGFSEKIDKVLVITADLRFFNRDREIHQAFIDGGMYAMRVLDSLNYKGIATIPLSASLTDSQDHNIRQALKIHEAEVFILLIGVGNYPDLCQTTKSERKMAEILVY